MPSIKENLEMINGLIAETARSCGRNPEDILLIAVTKKKNAETVMEALQCGAVHFGENYIQEAISKIDEIGKEMACWHFIGHLQSNKAAIAVKYFEYIHTVDSVKLAKEIDKQAKAIHKIQKILLQVNISKEKTKSGTDAETTMDLVRQIHGFENIAIQGLMCMPPYFDNPEQARKYFRGLLEIRANILAHQFPNVSMNHLSMGMSNDFRVAIEEGATMVRIGTSLFGERN
ncbi:MAG: YggS family pyridoxal phosphate enzyme [Desulfobacula sp. RIFOXYA12_FULL_46_16]|nr:MAG: YggS family pyridoxal phosphate enzyme [Deltaproteobacteria bacterium RIFOXYC2_FULL_48_10]OGR20894.1 MAG: YggS family pyridoxal phosphate enzyme [Desulfobacula sp. RIFOXYA12_FULL_46_16]